MNTKRTIYNFISLDIVLQPDFLLLYCLFVFNPSQIPFSWYMSLCNLFTYFSFIFIWDEKGQRVRKRFWIEVYKNVDEESNQNSVTCTDKKRLKSSLCI